MESGVDEEGADGGVDGGIVVSVVDEMDAGAAGSGPVWAALFPVDLWK